MFYCFHFFQVNQVLLRDGGEPHVILPLLMGTRGFAFFGFSGL